METNKQNTFLYSSFIDSLDPDGALREYFIEHASIANKTDVLTNPTPIGFFWDLNTCKIPEGHSAFHVVKTIRSIFLIDKREEDFAVVCDVYNTEQSIVAELSDAQVNIYHVSNTQINGVNIKLKQLMQKYSKIHPAPAAIAILTGDMNFADSLKTFKTMHNMEIILIYDRLQTPKSLIEIASYSLDHRKLAEVLPVDNKAEISSNKKVDTIIWNLPTKISQMKIAKRLSQLGDNCGGKVVSLTPPTALMRFPTETHAFRAIKRMTNEDVFGNKIELSSSAAAIIPPALKTKGGNKLT